MKPANRREQYVLPDARYRLRDVIAIPGGKPCVIGRLGPFSLDVGVIESNERANVRASRLAGGESR